MWHVAPLLDLIRMVYGLDLKSALSALVGQVKACNMNMSAEGWPYAGFVVANSRTQIRDMVDFAWGVGAAARVMVPAIVRVRKVRSARRGRKT